MTDLNELTQPDRRDALVTDLAALTQKTIDNQSGLSGTALKTAVKGATKVDESLIERGINKLLPQFLESLAPLWNGYTNDDAAAAGNFGDYLAAHDQEARDALLNVADRNTDNLPGPVAGVYKSLRGKAEKIVTPVLPELGEVIEKHAK